MKYSLSGQTQICRPIINIMLSRPKTGDQLPPSYSTENIGVAGEKTKGERKVAGWGRKIKIGKSWAGDHIKH